MQDNYNVGIYARLSRDDERQGESVSIENQKELLTRYVREQGWNLYSYYLDDGVSGTTFDRPGFNRLVQDATDGKINLVLCKDLSRLGRDYIEAGRYTDFVFPSLGCRFIALNDGVDTIHKNNEMTVILKNVMNDLYARDTSNKIKAVKQSTFKSGKYVGCYAPLGYKKSPEDKHKLIIDPVTAPIVRRIFDMRAQGDSFRKIARTFNDEGVPAPRTFYYMAEGRENLRGETPYWNDVTVKTILRNEVYIGHMVQNKTGTVSYKNHKQISKPRDQWIKVENTHEPLITYDDFMAVKTMLGRDMRSTSDSTEDNIFSGFVFCGDCGQPMTRKVVPSHGKKYYYYVCSTNKRKEGCSQHSISMKEVDTAVFNAIHEHVSHVLDIDDAMAFIERLPSADRTVFNYEAQITRIEEEIEKYKKLKLRLYEDLSDGVITKKEYMEFRNQYTDLIDDREAVLERVRRESQSAQVNGKAERAWAAMFREYENLQELNRRVLMALVDKILIFENHVIEVVFKYGDEIRSAFNYVKKYEDILPKAV